MMNEELRKAPQAQQPRIGTVTSVEQTLEQWEHDFRNPMTPEQQADWVKRERDFAARQAQQPAPVQEPVAHLWQHVETGRTRIVMPDAITDCDASWQLIGPLFLAAQQPRKAVKLSDYELVSHYCAIADGKEWAIGGLSDAVPFARAIEQAVLRKNRVTI